MFALVVPVVQSFAMLSHETEQSGVMLQGVDPQWATLDLLKEHMISGYLEQLQPGEFGVVLGSQVARRLNAFVGDRVQVTMPDITVTPAGIFPRIKALRVTGIFEVGAQVDSSVAFVHQQDARKLLRLGNSFQGMQLAARRCLCRRPMDRRGWRDSFARPCVALLDPFYGDIISGNAHGESGC